MLLLMVALMTGGMPPVQGTPLARRILERDGVTRIEYTAREDVCGDGRGMIRFRDRESVYIDDGVSWSGRGGWRNRICVDGPVRIALTVRDGRIARSRVYVGGEWPDSPADVRELGRVATREAADALLDLARRGTGRGADDLIFPALIADSVTVWRQLLDLARDSHANRQSRKSAVFWLSQEAGEAVVRELGDFVADDEQDREVREQAVFALSQLPREEGVPTLIRVARSNPDPSIRKKALFWLGQSEDPRALELFEEILTKP
jgi:HEAT repeats